MENKIAAPWRMSFDTDYTYFLENDYGTLGEVNLWNEDDANKITRLISLAPEMAEEVRDTQAFLMCIRSLMKQKRISETMRLETLNGLEAIITRCGAILAKLEAE